MIFGGLLPEERKATVGGFAQCAFRRVPRGGERRLHGLWQHDGGPARSAWLGAARHILPLQQLGLQRARDDLRTATSRNIYDAFEQDFAKPMQFQDFDRAQQRKTVNERASVHPAYHFYLSSRDMARVGYLMLRDGRWNGQEIVPRDWVRRITTVVTPVTAMNPANLRAGPFGSGYLWWIWDGPFNTGPYRGAYTGAGAIGQFITVLPALDMVVAHKTRQQGQASVSRQG